MFVDIPAVGDPRLATGAGVAAATVVEQEIAVATMAQIVATGRDRG